MKKKVMVTKKNTLMVEQICDKIVVISAAEEIDFT